MPPNPPCRTALFRGCSRAAALRTLAAVLGATVIISFMLYFHAASAKALPETACTQPLLTPS